MKTNLNIFYPPIWSEYELLDCGGFEKLERFGKIILRRPEPQALWQKQLNEKHWSNSDITFIQKGSHSGEWTKKNKQENSWFISYKNGNLNLKFRLALTSFKHIGIFPEQTINWDYIFSKVNSMKIELPKVLNLFAYTGGASLAAKAAGADVTHVDSVKQIISWSKENMELSGFKDIRWIVEDAMKFVKREVKRGKKYNGIILDPPAYGIGANGERWKLEDNIDVLLKDLSKLLDDQEYFFIINMYSLGFSPLILQNLIQTNFNNLEQFEFGELSILSKSNLNLPLGILSRFSNVL